jgi:ketosteroid isomerase-like protein
MGDHTSPICTIEAWLINFEKAVNDRDFEGALSLYSDSVVLFGSRVALSKSIEDYSNRQWRLIWNSSQHFKISEIVQVFDFDEIKTCAVLWTNETEIDMVLRKRSGRATFILHNGGRGLVAVHSHFSETPHDDHSR